MAKIVTLKDHKTNELAYPQTVSDAVYMDNGSTLEQYKESVSRQFANYPNVTVTGTVTNLPDNEDIRETEQHTLQFADRNNLEGMGYVILRKNIVSGVNTLTQSMMTQENTIYEIRYDFELNEDITLPNNCVLYFNGGKIDGNYFIDFTNSLQTEIYASWLGLDTMLNSIQYMNNRTLVIDHDIELTRPISYNNGIDNLGFFNIIGRLKKDTPVIGAESREYEKPVITCKNCSAIDLWDYSPFISNIIFHKDDDDDTTRNIPIIYLHGTGHSNDLDAKIDNCNFRGQGDSAITTYGRGLEIKNCSFAFSASNNQAAINCYLTKDTSSFYPTAIDRHERYAGRAFVIHNNRIHITVSNFIWFHVNEDTPTSCFEGIRIYDNLADTGSHLCRIDAPNYDTYIGNNTFIGGVDVYTPYFIIAVDSENLQIVSNVFSGLENADRPDYKRNFMRISLGLNLNDKIRNVSILDNIIQTDAYFIETASDIDGLQIINNVFTKQSFTRDSNPILVRATGSLKNVIIKNNLNQSYIKPKTLLFGGNVTGKDISNVIIKDNSNLYNYFNIFFANLSDFTYSNNVSIVNSTEWGSMNAREKVANHSSVQDETKIKFIDYVGNERYLQGRRLSTPMVGNSTPTPALPMSTEDIGQSILDDSVGYNRPMWYNGGTLKWLDALGRTKGILYGTSEERPANLNGEAYNIGYLYFDKYLGKPIWYKGRENNVDVWVDATGQTV